jgi:DNA helicase IV
VLPPAAKLAHPRFSEGADDDVTTVDPELEAEQTYIDHAYEALEASRQAASRMSSMVEVGRGGTEQARYERDVIWDTMLARLAQLDLGDAALCFGRIDREGDVDQPEDDTFYIGRIAVSDETQEPLVVDWRAPVAEPFYRATGREPMGLVRRRHFATRGRTLLGIEDELFGRAVDALDIEHGAHGVELTGQGALMAALETARTGRLGDIVGTIQAEQDVIIRSPLPGVVVVQGGPGTGKTVVALHRAAYLLYTHRFPLEGQGVLVVGPNRLFLSYIEQVLPSLGEAGVELAVMADLIDDVRVLGSDRGLEARTKGDLRMVQVLRQAVRDRGRPLRHDLEIGFGLQTLRLAADETAQIVRQARRRFRTHNAGRRYVEAEFFAALARSGWSDPDPQAVRDRLRRELPIRQALESMWPVLTPAQLLNDLLGSRALLQLAGRDRLSADEIESLHQPREAVADDVVWKTDDVPLLDEARALLGPRPRHKEDEDPRTYGHLVIDEAQDLSPMQLRLLDRRSLNGSMTIVGDIAQATGAWAHADWDDVLAHLPTKRGPRREELTVGYRIPSAIMEPAKLVLAAAAPGLRPPVAVREGGDPPSYVRAAAGRLLDEVVDVVRTELATIGSGNLAVICPQSLHETVSGALDRVGIDHGYALRDGLDHQTTVVPVGWVKGLELDASIVVEPAAIVDEEPQGMRSLYVALTRATKRLSLVHERELPDVLRR